MSLNLTESQYAALVGSGELSESWTRERVEQTLAEGGDLSNVDLRGLDLAGLPLAHVLMDGANLDGANLAGCDLRGATFTKANLAHANLAHTYLDYAGLRLARLDGADLSNCTARRTFWKAARLCKANLSGARLAECDFTAARLERVQWAGAVFDVCDFGDAVFVGCSLLTAQFKNCYWFGARFAGTVLDWTSQDLIWALTAKVAPPELHQRLVMEAQRRKFAPWHTWYPDAVVHDLSSWRRDGDNWPAAELAKRGKVKPIEVYVNPIFETLKAKGVRVR